MIPTAISSSSTIRTRLHQARLLEVKRKCLPTKSGAHFDKERVNGLIDQLVPPSERGEENRVDNILSERGKFLRTSIRTRTSPYMSIESWHNRGDGQVAISHVLMVIK